MTNQNKNLPIIAFSISALVVILAVLFSAIFINRIHPAESDGILAKKNTYLLKDYRGKIALYLPPSETPETVYDIYLITLPQQDQDDLTKGILLQSREEVDAYIDDFDS